MTLTDIIFEKNGAGNRECIIQGESSFEYIEATFLFEAWNLLILICA